MQTGSEDKDQHSERGKDVKAWGGEKLRRHREKKKKKARWSVISYTTRSCMLICPAVCLLGCFHMTRFRKNYNLSKRIFVSYDSSMLQLKSRNTTTRLHTHTHTPLQYIANTLLQLEITEDPTDTGDRSEHPKCVTQERKLMQSAKESCFHPSVLCSRARRNNWYCRQRWQFMRQHTGKRDAERWVVGGGRQTQRQRRRVGG